MLPFARLCVWQWTISKTRTDPNLKKEIEPLTKTINIDLGSEVYSMKLKNAQVYDFVPMLLQEADITLTTTPENLQALIDGTLRPMRAFVMKKVTIKGKIDDIMFLRKFF